MQQLTNEEITRVFAMYMPCEFMYEEEINNLVAVGNGWIYSDEADESGEGVFGTEDCKLLLTPLSAITDEHAIEISNMFGNTFIALNNDKKEMAEFGRWQIKTGIYLKHWEILEFLKLKSYATPLFFGINHLANGKTAIELGIAIDKTLAK